MKTRLASKSLAALLAAAAFANPAIAAEKPVKVYILSGQSNMVGIGQVTGSDSRWGKEFTDTVLSMYEGRSVGDPAKYPDFKGNVKSVDTRPFYRKPEVSPRNQGFHYNGNAETYMLVGEAMGKAMVDLDK